MQRMLWSRWDSERIDILEWHDIPGKFGMYIRWDIADIQRRNLLFNVR